MQKDRRLAELSLAPQQELVRKQTTDAGGELELNVMELEERIAPGFRLG
jgi:hypothetical protein